MRLSFVFWALVAQAFFAPAAEALEPFKLYDKFSDRPLDPARWADSERVRVIKGGAIHLMQRTWSSDAFDAGVTAGNWSENFTDPGTITQMRARITVTDLEANVCPSNVAVSDARARIHGSFFNIGQAIPGSLLNDVTAQVRLVRFSNSADPAGVLRVEGIVLLCSSADCALGSTIGNIVDLGTVHVGAPTTVQLQWDQGGQAFHFSRDGNKHAGSVGYPYAVHPPGLLFRNLSTRVNVPNCTTRRLANAIDTKFDNVFVNQTAQP
jgi:hypothetical protein